MIKERETAEKIHVAALKLLENPGVRLDHDEICTLLLRAGAKEGGSAGVIRFPEGLILEKLELLPESFVFANREGKGNITSPASEAVIWSVPGLRMVENNRARPFTSMDMAKVSRLLHHLENVDGIFGLALDDIPPRACDVVGLRIIAENTNKHIRVLCFTPEGSEMMMEMKKVVYQ